MTTSRFLWNQGFRKTEPELETGHCKVFLESEDVGRTLDLSVLESYEQLHERLANMFRIERSVAMTRVLYQDATGCVKQIGDEPFRYCFSFTLPYINACPQQSIFLIANALPYGYSYIDTTFSPPIIWVAANLGGLQSD